MYTIRCMNYTIEHYIYIHFYNYNKVVSLHRNQNPHKETFFFQKEQEQVFVLFFNLEIIKHPFLPASHITMGTGNGTEQYHVILPPKYEKLCQKN